MNIHTRALEHTCFAKSRKSLFLPIQIQDLRARVCVGGWVCEICGQQRTNIRHYCTRTHAQTQTRVQARHSSHVHTLTRETLTLACTHIYRTHTTVTPKHNTGTPKLGFPKTQCRRQMKPVQTPRSWNKPTQTLRPRGPRWARTLQ